MAAPMGGSADPGTDSIVGVHQPEGVPGFRNTLAGVRPVAPRDRLRTALRPGPYVEACGEGRALG